MNKKYCRVCLTTPTISHSLLENELVNMLESLTTIKVLADDMYSTIACLKCILNIKYAFNIQQKILKADEQLRNKIDNNQTQIKMEIVEHSVEDEIGKCEPTVHCKEVMQVCGSICTICGQTINGNLITDHIQEHFNVQQNCKVCGQVLNNIKEYREHRVCETKLNCFDCSICGAKFRYEALYNLHIKMHSEVKETVSEKRNVASDPSIKYKQNKRLKCPICAKMFGFQNRYDLHMKMHSLDKRGETKISGASKKSKVIQSIKDTFLEKMTNVSHSAGARLESHWKCPICAKHFLYKIRYDLHLASHKENGEKWKTVKDPTEDSKVIRSIKESFLKSLNRCEDDSNLQCGICGRTFASKRQLSQHSHDKKTCPICHASISKSNIGKHIKNHSSGPQICELCGATLCSMESLRGHLAHTHNTKTFRCEQCDKTFQKRPTYLLHRKRHEGKMDHICEICGKSFLTAFYLKTHINMFHLKLRPYACKYCTKRFSSRNAMRTHIRQHTNETPYRCEMCGEGFRQKVSLRSHRKSKHNIVEPKVCPCTVCGKKFINEVAVLAHMRLH